LAILQAEGQKEIKLQSGAAAAHSKTWPQCHAPIRACVLECAGVPALWILQHRAVARIFRARSTTMADVTCFMQA